MHLEILKDRMQVTLSTWNGNVIGRSDCSAEAVGRERENASKAKTNYGHCETAARVSIVFKMLRHSTCCSEGKFLAVQKVSSKSLTS